MADVRLTATNPEDSSVVPVACNAKGELLLEEPTLASDDYVAVTGDNMTGDLTLGTDKITLDASDGNGIFARSVVGKGLTANNFPYDSSIIPLQVSADTTVRDEMATFTSGFGGQGSISAAVIYTDGSAEFSGDIYAGKQFRTQNNYGAPDSGVLGLAVLGADGGSNASIGYDGSADFTGNVDVGAFGTGGYGVRISATGPIQLRRGEGADTKMVRIFAGTAEKNWIKADGSALFGGDVIVGSRNKRWMLVEQGGLCHMVDQTRADTADLVDSAVTYPPLRDVFAELNAIEKALGEVMEKLRMTPPAGWEVWDGSSENS